MVHLMNYNDFEEIYHYLTFRRNRKTNTVIFLPKKTKMAKMGMSLVKKFQNKFQQKYHDTDFTAFRREYKNCLPEYNQHTYRRRVLIKDFKSQKPENFTNLPLDKKLDYLDALSVDLRGTKEWINNYDGIYQNLTACLWTTQLPASFYHEEQDKINHFFNILDAKRLRPFLKNLHLLRSDSQQEVIRAFLDSFSEAYGIDSIPLKYYHPQNSKDTRIGFVTTGKWEINIRDNMITEFSLPLWSILFHEATHLRHQKLFEENPIEYRIFRPEHGRIENFVRSFYGADRKKQIYELMPRETHAYYVQKHFEETYLERYYDGRLWFEKYHSNYARTLWLDYQR